MRTVYKEFLVSVRVDIHDEDVIDRCVNNTTHPADAERGDTRGWRDVYYADIDNEDAVIEHLAWNCVMNHKWDSGELDGWADIDGGAKMQIVECNPW